MDLMVQQAVGGFMSALVGQLASPENMKEIVESILQPQSSDHCKSPADAAIVALKCFKNGQLTRDQALRICAIALEDSGKTIDVDSIAVLKNLFK